MLLYQTGKSLQQRNEEGRERRVGREELTERIEDEKRRVSRKKRRWEGEERKA